MKNNQLIRKFTDQGNYEVMLASAFPFLLLIVLCKTNQLENYEGSNEIFYLHRAVINYDAFVFRN